MSNTRAHIYALDFRGHGNSGRTPGQYLLRDYVVDVKAFLEHQLMEPAIVFGASLGGWVAVMVTA